MAFTAGNIISDVMAFWNRPSEQELPVRDVITIINRKVNRLLVLMQISDRNYLAELSSPFSFNGSEMTTALTFLDQISSIVRVESRSIGSDDLNWSEEIITDYGAWNDSMDSVIDSVAFYGSGDTLMMAVNRDASNMEFRVLYETGGVSLASFSETVPTLQGFFRGVVFYGTAAEAGMQLPNLNPQEVGNRNNKVSYALDQEMKATRDFEKWILNTPGQSVQYREAFNSTRTRSGQVRMFASDTGGGYYSRY